MFYSKSKNSFYNEQVHGARRMAVPDPAWQRPLVNDVPDQAALHPLLEVDNPACLIPADAVEITLEQYQRLLADQSSGKQIEADERGGPVAVEPPQPTLAAVKAATLSKVRTERGPILSMLDGMQASATAKSDSQKALAIEAAKQGLKDLTRLDFTDCVTPDDFKIKVMRRYREIAAALPLEARIAFAEALV